MGSLSNKFQAAKDIIEHAVGIESDESADEVRPSRF